MFKTSDYVQPSELTTELPLHENTEMLDEDDDQNEMDTIFTIGNISYTTFILLCLNNVIYPIAEDKENVGKFHLIMSNLWAFFPIMQAQGLWLKSLLAMTCYFSMTWHWYNIGHELPMGREYYRRLDIVFSVMSIVSYSMSWIPLYKTKIYSKSQERKSCCIKYCCGMPKQTAEWRCRWTYRLGLNILICIIVGAIIWQSEQHVIEICLVSIIVAFTFAMWQLTRGIMKVGSKHRIKFFLWASSGVGFGCIAFASKINDEKSLDVGNQMFWHALWHTYIFGSAFCISRASEYLQYNLS